MHGVAVHMFKEPVKAQKCSGKGMCKNHQRRKSREEAMGKAESQERKNCVLPEQIKARILEN